LCVAVDVLAFYDKMACSSLYQFQRFTRVAIIYFWSSLYNPNNSTKQLIDFLTLLQDSKQLTVTNVRTLKMTEDVLAVSISPEGKHIAVALLDCHVKVAL